MGIPKRILPVIVFSQFACTSLWFAGNAVIGNLAIEFNLPEGALANLTSSVQFGFIAGTLVFAILSIADRFSPSKVFLFSAVLGAGFNLITIWEGNSLFTLLLFRFLTGFFLAGIYPVGMKIAADYFEKGLGKSLGFLVGALVLGTAFPHFIKVSIGELPYRYVLLFSSALALLGGLLMIALVPNGPFRKPSQKLDFKAIFKVFDNSSFKQAAFGYFGHMWELYAFWAFVPVMLVQFNEMNPLAEVNVPLLSFIIIGMGGVACVVGGYLSEVFGVKTTAFYALLFSCNCCLFSPLIFLIGSKILFIGFLIFWGWVVIADSPLFSTLVAQNASPEIKGTALTIVNSIGFFITIFSIQLIYFLSEIMPQEYSYTFLGIGPVLGLIALTRKKN